MLVGVAAIALGLDTGVLAQLSTASTGTLEQKLVDHLRPAEPAPAMMQGGGMMMAAGSAMRPGGSALPVEGQLPSLDGAVQWLNSPALSNESLKGKVVLVDFWTYSCINCLRALPYVKAWAEKYRDQGLVVIGVHAPEFAFERDVGNVTQAMQRLGITYPVALDNDYAIWRAFNNQYWPAHYFVDAQGRVRFHHFGEGEYARSERVIQQLLKEAGAQVSAGLSTVQASGEQMAGDLAAVRSPETYVGYGRAENFASPGGARHDQANRYQAPSQPTLNQWGLNGNWNVGEEQATATAPGAGIVYRFQARDLHLVLAPGSNGKPVRFKVTLDGQAPGAAHGMDVREDGTGVVTEQRLYQLLRQPGDVREHTFSIEFLDPGVAAYAFTFG